jgi:hypothetical protein
MRPRSSRRCAWSAVPVDWIDFDACAALGLDAFVGKLHLTPRPATRSRA